jgi:Abnormal spindle-like microcephaly-assoc'd, ASPM-SPD-2-Hydin
MGCLLRAAGVAALAAAVACGSLLDVGEDRSIPTVDGGASADADTDAPIPVQATCGLSVEPTSLDFGEVFVGRSSAQTITIKNLGGVASTVTATTTSGVFTIAPPSVSIGPAAEAQLAVTFAPSATGASSAEAGLSADGCTLPKVALKGTGVPAGGFTVQPGSVSLMGRCNELPSTAEVTIASGSSLETSFTIAPAGVPFIAFAVDAGPTTLPANETRQATIRSTSLLPPSPGTVGPAKLKLTITAEPDPRNLDVFATARGAALAFSKSTVGLSNKFPTENVIVTNSGNAPISVTFKKTGQGFTVNPPTIVLAAGTASSFVVSTVGNLPASGTVSLTVTGDHCGALPALVVTPL